MYRLSAVAVCLLLCCLCSRTTFAAGNDPRPDKLFADYSALVRANFQPLQLPIGPMGVYSNIKYNPAVLSQGALATLETAHGGDARYWELRYWCLQMESLLGRGSYGFDADWSAQKDDSLAIELLVKARDCGAASPFALYSLAQIQRDQRKREIAAIENDPALAEDARLEVLIYAMAADEEEFARALERINAACPDEAWPKWWHADELFHLGEMDQACNWLEEGNAAAKCSYPACWPESLIRTSVAQGEAPGGEVLCGAVLQAGRMRGLAMALRWKGHMKEAVLAFKLGGNLRPFNALQSFVCRYAGSAGVESTDCVLAIVFSKAFAGELLRNHSEELSQEQVNALLDLQREVDRLQSRLRGLGRDSELFNESLLGAVYTEMYPVNNYYESDLEAARERLRSIYLLLPQRRYRAYYAYIAQELRIVQDELAPRLALLGAFDFSAPATFEQWDTY